MPYNVNARDTRLENKSSWEIISYGFSQLGKELAKKLPFNAKLLLDGIRGNRPNRTNTAEAPPAARSARRPAAPPLAPPSPQEQAVCRATVWLTGECNKIKDALTLENGNPKKFNTITLTELREAARDFKTSVQTHLANNGVDMPPDLRRDFEENISLMNRVFNDNSNRPINIDELQLLTTYIKHLKNWFKGDGNELENSFQALEARLNELIGSAAEEVGTARSDFDEAKKIVDQRQTNLENAQAALQAQPVGAAPDRLNVLRQAVTIAGEELTGAQTAATAAKTRLEALTKIPSEVTTKQELVALQERLRVRVTNIGIVLNRLNASPIPHTQEEVEFAERLENELRAKTAEIDTLNVQINHMDTKDTIKNFVKENQIKEIETVLGYAAPRPADAASDLDDQLITTIQQQIDDVTKLASAQKNSEAAPIERAKEFVQLMRDLAADPGTQTSVPQNFADTFKHTDGFDSHPIGDKTIYAHAIDILNARLPVNGIDDQIIKNGVRDKKLALTILAGHCIEHALRNIVPAAGKEKAEKATNAFVPSKRAGEIKARSSQLLGASIILKRAEEAEIAGSSQKCRDLFLGFADLSTGIVEMQKLNKLGETLNTLPDNVSVTDLRDFFKKGVTLEVAQQTVGQTYTAERLLQKAKTDRTYESGSTWGKEISGTKSREKVFKESVLAALEFIKTGPDPEDTLGKTRMFRANKAIADERINLDKNHLKSLLGFNTAADGEDANNIGALKTSNEFLDQLNLAAIVHNDLSTNKGLKPRGSLASHAENADENSTVKGLMGQRLKYFGGMSKTLAKIGVAIRPFVEAEIEQMKTRLNTPVADGVPPVSSSEIERLVKQIQITTDYKAAHSEGFNLASLTRSAKALSKSNTRENRHQFKIELDKIKQAWTTSLDGKALEINDWNGKDKRNVISKNLKANPFKSVPVINQIPVLSTLVGASARLAQFLVLGAAGAAGISVVGAVVASAATIAVPAYGAFVAINTAIRSDSTEEDREEVRQD